MYIKFGIKTSDTAQEIRDEINRKEGAMLVEKYDGEFPVNTTNFLNIVISQKINLLEIVDSWRSDRIWKKK